MPAGYQQVAQMGLGVIGGQLQGWAALLDKWAMEDAYKQEIARQAGYQGQATGVFNDQLQGAGYPGLRQQMGNSYASRLADYNAIDATPLGFNVSGQGSASNARDVAAARMAGGQRANLMKYGDALQAQKIGNMKTGRALDQITNFAGGTARVFPYRMYDAQHAWDAMAQIGAQTASAGGALSGGKVGGPLGQQQQPPSSSMYYPYGSNLPGYSQSPGFTDAYGNYYPQGWNTMPTGSAIPG